MSISYSGTRYDIKMNVYVLVVMLILKPEGQLIQIIVVKTATTFDGLKDEITISE